MSINNKIAVELSQVARKLFDSAADDWYFGVFLQVVTGLIGLIAGFLVLSGSVKLIFAVIGFIVLVRAVYLRIRFEDKYNRAETMRRQAAFTEGLGWSISDTLKSEWMRRVGQKIIEKAESDPRSNNYYSSKQKVSPKKLLTMTIESAFYTRHLYCRLANVIWVLFSGSIISSFLVLSFLPAKIVPDELSLHIAYAIFLILPILLSSDLLGSIYRLNGLKTSIIEIEKDLEVLSKDSKPNLEEVLRLVSEYNCQVACGFPIHNMLFTIWHKEIDKFWSKRRK